MNCTGAMATSALNGNIVHPMKIIMALKIAYRVATKCICSPRHIAVVHDYTLLAVMNVMLFYLCTERAAALNILCADDVLSPKRVNGMTRNIYI
jgi:hypothetical protein